MIDAKSKKLKSELLPHDELLKLIRIFYEKLMNGDKMNGLAINNTFSLYYEFVKYFWERYDLRDTTLQKCGEVLYSSLEFMGQDERIEHFALFIGLRATNCRKDIPIIYLSLLKAMNVRMDVLFGEEYKQEIPFETACERLFK